MYKATPPPEMLIENGELLALKKVTFEHRFHNFHNICKKPFDGNRVCDANIFHRFVWRMRRRAFLSLPSGRSRYCGS